MGEAAPRVCWMLAIQLGLAMSACNWARIARLMAVSGMLWWGRFWRWVQLGIWCHPIPPLRRPCTGPHQSRLMGLMRLRLLVGQRGLMGTMHMHMRSLVEPRGCMPRPLVDWNLELCES